MHGVLVEAVAKALFEIFKEGRYADKVIEFYLKNQRQWGSRDRRFFAESVYEMVRWWRTLWWLKGSGKPGGEGRGLPLSFDIEDLKKLWAYGWAWRHGDFSFLSEEEGTRFKQKKQKSAGMAIDQSVPDWLHQRGLAELGSIWEEALPALNRPAKVYLRVNTLRIQPEKLMEVLAEEGVVTHVVDSHCPEILVLEERKNVFATKAFQQGFFEVQDWASQQVAPLLDAKPGQRVIDACAGAGGKSLHLASLMKNKGKIISMDIHEWKLKELRSRASRAGVDIIEVKLIEGQKTIKRLAESADRVLLDVPCSGIGVLKRNPDTKWKLSSEEIDRLRQLQQDILQSYSRLLRPGGKLVYSTCSIFPSENEKQVAQFLENNPHFGLVQEMRCLPQQREWDGFYAAVMVRAEAPATESFAPTSK